MAETRPANDDLAAVVADLRREVADLKGTTLYRSGRMPTGFIGQTILDEPLPDTLFMQGQTLNRADYPGLWQWVVDHDRIGPGLFGNGDGSTTFVMPDWREVALVGASSARPVGTEFGAQSKTISWNQMPSHDHNVGIDVGGATNAHQHGFQTAGVGGHDGHTPFDAPGVGDANGSARWPTNQRYNYGAHGHSGLTANDGPGHEHYSSVSESSAGGNQSFNVEQPSLTINWVIWT